MVAQLLPLPAAPEVASLVDRERPRPALHPLQAALRELSLREAEILAADFSDHLDEALQTLVNEARNAFETRNALALGDALRLGRASLLRQIAQAFTERLAPLPTVAARPQLLDLSKTDTPTLEELEDSISLNRLAQLSEQLAGGRSLQLRSRLNSASRKLGLPALASAFTPATPGNCFAAAFRALGLPAEQRALAYRLVEQRVLPRWPALLEAVLQLLDQQALDFPQPAAGEAANTPVAPPATAAPAPARPGLRSGLSNSASQVITEGFLPLLASIRRRHGSGSREDQETLGLLNEFAASFDPEVNHTTRMSLTLRIGDALQAAGLPEDRLHALLESLTNSYAQFGGAGQPAEARLPPPPAAGTAATGIAGPLPRPTTSQPPAATPDAQKLSQLLRAEQWFRLRDPKSGDDRWLCLAALYQPQDRLSFRGSDGTVTLGMRASQFVQDLLTGRAEPLNPDTEIARALRGARA
jgi:hypothetical protein